MRKWILAAMPLMMGVLSVGAQVKKPATKPAAAKQAGGGAAQIAKGKVLYKQYCMTCHQENGTGVPRMNPPLVKTEYVLGDKKRLIGILLNGLNEDVEINGDYFTNPMPSQAALKDQEIADILSYVRNSFGNKASTVSVGEVTAVRATIK
ncbi:c-type cytochrome [Chitinophaga ginsengisoli]|uniref:Mono/diheme cytochrome c family protein n=1 Tax=Chitinophaga ginsengisoli TaxID=363837 RepID=A0A2P8FS62_9BACT|nr:cytochrome c [Chitinophaga ginsengisoli]PSL24543.1 mono/diheme cytochrome c family protein [Chitinophaga ginsengisoli]